MSRISALLVAAGLLAGSGGCAQCDTCDDFPAPCTGPNCAGAYDLNHGPLARRGPDNGGAPAIMNPATPSDDAAGPIPPPPGAGPGPGAAPAGPGESSPPLPTEPRPRTRPGF
jgi:hypothetical protein